MTRSLLCLITFFVATSTVNADLVSFSDEFANSDGATGTVTPTDWSTNNANATFRLESGDANDGDVPLDAAGDGYAVLQGNVTANGSSFVPVAFRNIGNVTAADVGSVINLQMSYLEVEQGGSMSMGLASNGAFVTGAHASSVSTFDTNPDADQFSFTYTVTAADVGDTLSAKFEFFTTNNDRQQGLDTVNVTVTAVPEPTGIAILGLFGLAGMMRRRR